MDRRDDFLWRFLNIFAPILYKLEMRIDEIPDIFDPLKTPKEFLDYLASWVALELNHNWPESKQRLLVKNIARLYKTRGTPDGIATFVEIYTGYRPQIISHPEAGMQIGIRSKIGVNTKFYGSMQEKLFRFTVLARIPDPTQETIDEVHKIVKIQKPSWADYYLVVQSTFMQIGVTSTIGVDTILGN